MQAVMLFVALCGLGLTAYAIALGNSVSIALIPMAVPVAVTAIPLVILWRLPFDDYIDAGKLPAVPVPAIGRHPDRAAPATPVEQDSADANQAVSDPIWAKVATSWWYMGVVFPAVCVSAGFLAAYAGWWGSSRTPVILFFKAPHFLFILGAAVFFSTNHSLEERFGMKLRGVSLLARSRLLRSELPLPAKRRLVTNLVGAALFMPAIAWEIFGWLAASILYP